MSDPSATDPTRRAFSIILPSNGHPHALRTTLSFLFKQKNWQGEVILADAKADKAVKALAEEYGCRVIHTGLGRGRQMKEGAEAARHHWLVFLYPGCWLDREWYNMLGEWIQEEEAENNWRCFQPSLESEEFLARLMEKTYLARTRWKQIASGWMGLVITKELYLRAGGHEPTPVFEEISLFQRLKRNGKAKGDILPVTIYWPMEFYAPAGLKRTVFARCNGAYAASFGAGGEFLQRVLMKVEPHLNAALAAGKAIFPKEQKSR
jgi:hypothetical protein